MKITELIKCLDQKEKEELFGLLLTELKGDKYLSIIHTKVKTLDWIESNHSRMSGRLYHGLKRAASYFDNELHKTDKNYRSLIEQKKRLLSGINYLETITKSNFFGIDHLGKGSWEEFIKIRGY